MKGGENPMNDKSPEKKKYIPVKVEVMRFEWDDVITTSNPSTNQTGGIYELPRI